MFSSSSTLKCRAAALYCFGIYIQVDQSGHSENSFSELEQDVSSCLICHPSVSQSKPVRSPQCPNLNLVMASKSLLLSVKLFFPFCNVK